MSGVVTASKCYKGVRYNYVSIAGLKKLLDDNGFNQGYLINRDTPSGLEVFRHDLPFVAGMAEIRVVHAGNGMCSYEIWFDGSILLNGTLSVLVRDDTEANIAYQCASKALASRLKSAIDPAIIRKKYQANRVKKVKNWNTSEFLNVIRTVDMSNADAFDAIRYFRLVVKDTDYLHCSSWVLSVIDTKVEQWASLAMQAYGNTIKKTVQLYTGENTYTTTLISTSGWHTE